MASVQEPEVQLAQRLASNEKPIRTKAIKKLRRYIIARSQNKTGGFSSEELLKLWKGLFYCLWMQDKPLLQEELSNVISVLIHSFHDIDGRFLYLETSLQTFKREWTGIDRLRMDKFFQLVRFMFRQTFQMLKGNNWESSLVDRFLELLTTEILHSGSSAPSGLQFHILDLYMTELAAMGSSELTADQNLKFIEPFCKTAAKTKDRTLFRAICNSIFSTIIDQAPYAIEDLMRELKSLEDSDSGQASEEDEECQENTKMKMANKSFGKNNSMKINGNKAHQEDALSIEDSDTEPGCDDDDDMTAVLQFDYAALADKLLELSSRSNTPSHNRQRLYKVIKVLRDLSEGIFPQDEYPEEVSTDEDDEYFGSRKRMKRQNVDHTEDSGQKAKKKKKSKGEEKSSSLQESQHSEEDGKPTDLVTSNEEKKKKKKKKKKKNTAACGETAECLPQMNNIDVEEPVSSKVTEDQSETELKVNRESLATSGDKNDNNDKSEEILKEKKQEACEPKSEESKEQQNPINQEASTTSEMEMSEADGKRSRKKKKKVLKSESQKDCTETESPVIVEEISAAGEDVSEKVTVSESETGVPAKGKKMALKAKKTGTIDAPAVAHNDSSQDNDVPLKRNKQKSKQEEMVTDQEAAVATSTPLINASQAEISMTTPAKKTKKKAKVMENGNEPQLEAVDNINEIPPLDESNVVSSSGKVRKKKRKIPVVFEFEADEVEAAELDSNLSQDATVAKKTKKNAEELSTPQISKTSQKKAKNPTGSASDMVSFQTKATIPSPLFCRTKGSPKTTATNKKNCQTPKSESKKVTFHLKNNKTADFRKNDRSLLLSPEGPGRVPFDPEQKPKSGILKSPPTPFRASKKNVGVAKGTPKRRPTAADFF